MADFCKECSQRLFDAELNDLAGITTREETSKGLFAVVICEGCGLIQVDHTGKCIGGENCLEGHTYP